MLKLVNMKLKLTLKRQKIKHHSLNQQKAFGLLIHIL